MSNNLPTITAAVAARRLRVLVWCPHIDANNGARLLGNLVPALVRRPEVELIRLLVPDRAQLPALEVGPVARLEIVPIPSWRSAFQHLNWIDNGGRIFGIPGTLRLKTLLRRRLWATRWTWLHARMRELASDCDLVYAFWPHEHDFVDFGKPVVCTFHDATVLDFPEILGSDRTNAEFKRARVWLDRSVQVIVPSEATKTALIRQFGESLGSARVIRQTILAQSTGEVANDPDTHSNLPEKYFVCVVNLVAQENLETLLVAWSRFKRRHFFPLLLIGHGTELLTRKLPAWPEGFHVARLAGLVHRLGIEVDQSIFVRDLADAAEVTRLIGHAYALIVPSLTEGGGSFPAEEALAHGVPVCCSDIPALREQLEEHSARISWFDPLFPESILIALGDLTDHYSEYKDSSVRGMTDVRQNGDKVAQDYVGVFLTAASRS